MSDKPGMVVAGASGRMGQMLIKVIQDSDTAKLTGAFERPGHAWVGQDLGRMMGGFDSGVFARANGT